jgi:hypothetical protein
MKKTLLIACLMGGAVITASAQANSVLVYGDFRFEVNEPGDNTRQIHFNLNPGIGYQFDNHWTAGLEGGFGTVRTKGLGSNLWDYENKFSAGPFVRYTQPLGRKNIFAFFAQAGGGYNGMQRKLGGASGAVAHHGGYAYVRPAIGVNVYKGFALNFGMGGIDFNTMSRGNGSNITHFGITFGQQFNIGISKNFACGKRKHSTGTNHGSRKHHHDDEQDDD